MEILVSIVCLIAIIGIALYIYAKIRKRNNRIKHVIQNRIKEIIKNKEGFENYITVFDIFKEAYGTFILNKLIDENKNLKISEHTLSSIIKEEVTKKETILLLGDAYIEWISNNIQEAADIEEEAIEYHKSFGKEPDGDPELHIRENEETSNDYTSEIRSIDDLMNTGTIEDID